MRTVVNVCKPQAVNTVKTVWTVKTAGNVNGVKTFMECVGLYSIFTRLYSSGCLRVRREAWTLGFDLKEVFWTIQMKLFVMLTSVQTIKVVSPLGVNGV